MAGELEARLVSDLPQPLRVGGGTALFVRGVCRGRHERLALELGGLGRPLRAAPGYPDPATTSFWSSVPVSAAEGGNAVLEVSDGSSATELARLELDTGPGSGDPLPSPPGWPSGSQPVAICMATHEPDIELLERQIASLREQTHQDWVCVISDDRSSAQRLAEIERVIEGDRRFLLSQTPSRLGAYANFERALSLAPRDAAYLALCDQDDSWYPEKLELLLEALSGGGLLAHCEMRVVDRDGAELAPTYWPNRRQATPGLAGLIAANSVTGAASLLRRELLDDALPFPPRLGFDAHDHWLAIVAAVRDGVRFVDRPLQDYVQHPGSLVGHEVAKPRREHRSLPQRARGAPREAPQMYFEHYCARQLFCVALLERAGDLPDRARRTLERFAAADRRPLARAWLVFWSLACLAGRSDRAGMVRALGRGVIWARRAKGG